VARAARPGKPALRGQLQTPDEIACPVALAVAERGVAKAGAAQVQVPRRRGELAEEARRDR
jgi:hypothetical protein